jgi:Zn-dependent alcohol dehydrogenase
MRAVVITKPGGPEVLEWLEVPDPEPGPGDVLIEVAAAGLNRGCTRRRPAHRPIRGWSAPAASRRSARR